MFDIASLSLSQEAVEYQFRHPVTGELLFSDEEKTKPVSAILYGKASKQYRNALNAMLNRSLARKAKKEKESAQVMTEEGVTLLVAITGGFKELAVEGTVPTTEADFRNLYSNPSYSWVKDQINDFVGSDDGAFLAQPQSA